jgi:hypothetical protein
VDDKRMDKMVRVNVFLIVFFMKLELELLIILQGIVNGWTIFNQVSTKITRIYLSITKEEVDDLYNLQDLFVY